MTRIMSSMSSFEKNSATDTSPKKCVIYCRVSSLEQIANTSLEHQEKACREFAACNGWVIATKPFIEMGESAKTADRTELKGAIEFCSNKKNGVNYFVVYKADRFARNVGDHFTVRALLKRYGAELRSATEQFDDSPIGKAMEGVAAVFAEWDNNTRSVRSKDGMMKRVREGVWVWAPSLGFYKPTKGKSTNIHPEPERAPYLRMVFEEYSKGMHTYRSLAERIGARGLRTKAGKIPSPQLIEKILRNPVYCGRIEAFGEVNKGSFEPIISEQLFDLCQNVGSKGDIQARSTNNPLFPLRKFVVCSDCGQKLTGSRSTDKRGRKHAYYHHGAKKCSIARSIPKAAFEQQFIELLDDIVPDEKYEKLFKAVVLNAWQNRYKKFDDANARVRTGIEKFEQERQKVFDSHRQGKYDDNEFLEQKNFINQRIQEKKLLLQDTNTKEVEMEQALDYAFYFIRNASKIWLESTYERRIGLQKLIFTKPVPFNGETFGTPELSLVYQQKKTPFLESSSLVAPGGIEPPFSP